MVDFNSEQTLSAPATDIVRVLILQYRADTFEALGDYLKKEANTDPPTNILRARIFLWFTELEAGIKRRYNAGEEYIKLKKLVKSEDFDRLLEAIELLNEECDTIRLTRIDTRQNYDRTRVEQENKVKGL